MSRSQSEEIKYLNIPHLDTKLKFVYPAKGPARYDNIRNQIIQDDFIHPAMSHNTSLVHHAWKNQEEIYSKEVIQLLRNIRIWSFNKINYFPNKGAHIRNDQETKDITEKFVPFSDYKIGEQSPKELAKNKFVIALAGEEGAEKLAEIASYYKETPYLWSFDNVNEQIERVAALNTYWGSNRLDLCGIDKRYDRYGYAFALSEVA